MDDTDALLRQFAAEGQAETPRLPLPAAPQSLQKLRYTHDAMIDQIIHNPAISQNELAGLFGYSAPSISRIVGSDAFQARLHERKKELVDPGILASIEERFQVLAQVSLEVIQKKLEEGRSVDLALKAIDVSAKALGYGARQPQVAVTNQFVVSLPQQANTQEAWIEKYGRMNNGNAVDITPKEQQSGT